MAEGVFRSLIKTPPYNDLIDVVDSCGTGAYHIGNPPDSRTMSTLEDHGVTDYVHRARTITPQDFNTYDYIFAMDASNLHDLQSLRARKGLQSSRAKVMLFGEFAASSASGSRTAASAPGSRTAASAPGSRTAASAPGSRTAPPEEVEDPYYGARDGFEVAYEQCVRFSRNFLAGLRG